MARQIEFGLPGRRRMAYDVRQENNQKNTMPIRIRSIGVTLAWLLSIIIALGVGAWLAISFVRFNFTVGSSYSGLMFDPPHDYPFPTVEAFQDANQMVDHFLNEEATRARFPELGAHYIIVPTSSGYTSYFWTNSGEEFPQSLLGECTEIARNRLLKENN
jgi:hypothetical protein